MFLTQSIAFALSLIISFSGLTHLTSTQALNSITPSPLTLASVLSPLDTAIYPSPSPTPSASASPTPSPAPTPKPSPTPLPSLPSVTGQLLDEWFTKYANQYSIDRALLHKIAVCESRLNPLATNGIYAGLYQFSGATWKTTRRNMGENPDPALRFYPEEAIKTAAYKLSHQGTSAWPNCSK